MALFDDKTTLLIFSPHADDEILGCGGLISKVKKMKGYVHVCLFSCGDFKNMRKKEFETVMTYLNVDSFNILYSDEFHLKIDTVPTFELIQNMEQVLNKIKPSLCALPYPSFNQDHKAIYEAGIAALRAQENKYNDIIVYEYPQVGWNLYDPPFTPNLYLDIGEFIDRKVECFELYKSQQKTSKYAISSDGILTLAKYRGKEVSLQYAEGYMLKRRIEF